MGRGFFWWATPQWAMAPDSGSLNLHCPFLKTVAKHATVHSSGTCRVPPTNSLSSAGILHGAQGMSSANWLVSLKDALPSLCPPSGHAVPGPHLLLPWPKPWDDSRPAPAWVLLPMDWKSLRGTGTWDVGWVTPGPTGGPEQVRWPCWGVELSKH